ncbi:OCIA domain-containing protein 2 [Anabarilius grahami]|uniref:OCIA domain-containing protein 2 n=1 Tax=Anabarilius grahami TaxID=495550 RepID=A0A3N0YXG6_ANAGA|nr:OCIA domain-containing protein 2 [Anabarilius grahami]
MAEKDMTTEGHQSTKGEGPVDTKPGQSGWKQFQCPIADPRFPREDMKQIWKECQYESFWLFALVKRDLTVAGIVGFAVGKASYVGTCREKFYNKLGPEFTKGFGPSGFGPGGFRHGHKHCIHVCERCKQQEAQAATAPDAPTQS